MINLELGRLKGGIGAVGSCWESWSSLSLRIQIQRLMESGFMKPASAASLRVNTPSIPLGFWFGARGQDFKRNKTAPLI